MTGRHPDDVGELAPLDPPDEATPGSGDGPIGRSRPHEGIAGLTTAIQLLVRDPRACPDCGYVRPLPRLDRDRLVWLCRDCAPPLPTGETP